MSEPSDSARLDASASGEATVYQAGRDLHIRIESQAGRSRPLVPGRTLGVDASCPYPGLAAFTADDTPWFFGREALLADVLQLLAEPSKAEQTPLILVASSGAGKTSLLQAGLLPALRRGALPQPGSSDWPFVHLSPTAHPLAELAAQLSTVFGAPADHLRDLLSAAPSQTTELLNAAISGGQLNGNGLVVAIDQFEEVFALCEDETERSAFIDAVCALAPTGRPSGSVVVLSMRADFYLHACAYPRLRDALRDRQVPMGPMSREELTQAIIFPADVAGLELEPGLIELLIRDLGGTWSSFSDPGGPPGYEAGRLPLLAHALRATWQQRSGHTLTVAGYLATGGIYHAIATSAERAFGRLSDVEREVAHPLFLRMVSIGDNGEDTRRLVPAAELTQSGQRPGARAVIDAFTQARLLTHERDAVELTHEAMITHWPRLAEWVEADRAGRLIRQNLEERAAEWDAGHKDPSALYRGHRLDEANAWASDPTSASALTTRAQAFLKASKRLRRRAKQVRTAAIASLSVLAILASTLAAVAQVQRHDAIHDRDQAIFNALNAEAANVVSTDPSLAAELDLAAYRMYPTRSLYTDLITAEAQGLGTPFKSGSKYAPVVDLSANGRILASAGNHIIRLWNMADPEDPHLLWSLARTMGQVKSIALAASPSLLIAGYTNGMIRIWNTADPAHPIPTGPEFHVPGGAAYGAKPLFDQSADELLVLAAGKFELWRILKPGSLQPLRTPRMLSDFSSPCVMTNDGSWSLSPDGRTLAIGCQSDQVILDNVSNLDNPRVMSRFSGTSDGNPTDVVTFSPSGRVLMTSAYGDLSYLLWKVADPYHPKALGPGENQLGDGLNSAAFGPGDDVLATGDADGTVQLWDLEDPQNIVFLGPAMDYSLGPVWDLAYSSTRRYLVSSYENGELVSWDIPRQWIFANDSQSNGDIAFSPDGKLLAASNSGSNLLDTWEVHGDELAGHQYPRACTGGGTQNIAFDPRARILAVGCDDATFRLYSLADPVHMAPLSPFIVAGSHKEYVNSEAFNRAGNLMATGADSTIALWNVSDAKHPKELSHFSVGPDNSFTSISICNSAPILAVAQDAIVSLWNISDPTRPRQIGELTGPKEGITWIAFSSNGVVAASSFDDHVYLWHPLRRHQLRYDSTAFVLSGHTDSATSIAFSQNGNILASGGDDDLVRLWRITRSGTGQPFGNPLTGHTDDVLAVDFSPANRKILVSIGFDNTVYLWNLNVNVAIARICATTRSVLTPTVWRKEIGSLPFHPPCSS